MIYDDPPYRCTFLSLFLVRQSRLFEECAGRTRGFIHSAKVIIKINAEPIGSQLAIFVPGALFWFAPFHANARAAQPLVGASARQPSLGPLSAQSGQG